MDIQVGETVWLIGTGITGTVDDVTVTMIDDDLTLEPVAIRFIEDGSGGPIRVTAPQVEVIIPGQIEWLT